MTPRGDSGVKGGVHHVASACDMKRALRAPLASACSPPKGESASGALVSSSASSDIEDGADPWREGAHAWDAVVNALSCKVGTRISVGWAEVDGASSGVASEAWSCSYSVAVERACVHNHSNEA